MSYPICNRNFKHNEEAMIRKMVLKECYKTENREKSDMLLLTKPKHIIAIML